MTSLEWATFGVLVACLFVPDLARRVRRVSAPDFWAHLATRGNAKWK